MGRAVLALCLADKGEFVRAEATAREAVAIAEATGDLNIRGDSALRLAEVLASGGRTADARLIADEALQLYVRKGNLTGVRRTRDVIRRLG